MYIFGDPDSALCNSSDWQNPVRSQDIIPERDIEALLPLEKYRPLANPGKDNRDWPSKYN